MVGSARPVLLILICLVAANGSARPATADEPPASKPDAKGAGGDKPMNYGLPGEDAPQPFVPLHPMTVEDRRRIEAFTDYIVARALEDQNSWNAAIGVLNDALKIDPESVAILRRLSRLCFALRRTDQGLDYARRALQADPDDPDTIERIIRHFKQRGARDEKLAREAALAAVAELEKVLANPKLPKNSAARLYANKELGFLLAADLNDAKRAVEPLAKLLDALDEKFVARLPMKDQRRVMDQPAETYIALGEIFSEAKRPDLAARAYERGLVYDDEDQHPELALKLAESLAAMGKNEEALAVVERFLKRQPQGSEAYELLARILTALKREKEITPRLEQAAKADSKNLMLQYALADRYDETGQNEKADALRKSLLSAQPTAQGYKALSAALFKRKKTDELVSVLVQALSKGRAGLDAVAPTVESIVKDRTYSLEIIDHGLKMLSADPPAIDRATGLQILSVIGQTRAKAAEDAGESAELELAKLAEVFRLAIKLEPRPIIYRQLADTLRRQGKLADAAKSFEDLIEKYPDQREAKTLTVLGELRRAANEKDGAITAFREALKLEPKDVEATYNLAMVLSQSGKFDEAISLMRSAIKDDATNPYYVNALGYVLSQSGKNDEAIAFYKGVLERHANNEDLFKMAHNGLSIVYINMGDYSKGEAELEAIFTRYPEEPGVNNDLGYLYADQGKNLEKAEMMIRKALRERPEESAYLDSLGWVLFKRGKPKDALEPLEKAVKKSQSSSDATIFEHLGDVYFELKEYAKAKDAWLKAESMGVKNVPPEKRLPEIRKKLKSLEKLGSSAGASAGKTP